MKITNKITLSPCICPLDMKRSEVLIQALILMKHAKWKKPAQKATCYMIHIYDISRIRKPIETERTFSSVQFSCSVVSDSATPWITACQASLCHHQLPEFTQTHVHWVSDAIQPSHPLSSPSPPAPNPSQHQGLFQWVNSSHEVAKVLEFQLQHQFFQWTPRTDLL